MVTLSIDGTIVSVKNGTTILEAAAQAGSIIPTLCYDKRLAPYGASFICAVEVRNNGREMLVPACVTRVEEGMEVPSNSPKVRSARRTQLMLLLKSHPLSCPTCDAAGNCRLQRLVRDYEIADLSFSRETREYHADNRSPFIGLDMNVCIKCGLCVRTCSEVQGENALSFVKRGTTLDVSTDFGKALECEFCGQCAQICPVGAIFSKWLVGTARQFQLEDTDTVCSFCSLGCTLRLRAANKRIVYVTSPEDSPNQGMLCAKGRYGWPYVYSDKRLHKPLIRKNGVLQEVEWDEALDFVADGFQQIRRAATPARLAALGSARLTNEEAWVFNRLVRTVLGTPHLDHGAGLAYRTAIEGLGEPVPNRLPGFCHMADPRARKRFEAAWQALLPPEDGLDAHSILNQDLSGRVLGLYVVGEDPASTYPDWNMVRQAMMGLDFLVVQDPFLTDSAKMADGVLPAACFSEKFGTYTSAERRIQLLRPLSKPTGAKSDLEIFQELAARMGKPFPPYTGPAQIMDEIARAVDVYRGVSYTRLSTGGIQWPCRHFDDPGTEVLYATGSPRGKAKILPAPPIDTKRADDSSLYLLARTVKFHSGSLSQWSPSLMQVCPECIAEKDPHDMQAQGLQDDDVVRITSHNGKSGEIIVQASSRPWRGCVIVPHHFPSSKLNAVLGWEQSLTPIDIEMVTDGPA